jgi:hypothetical protein
VSVREAATGPDAQQACVRLVPRKGYCFCSCRPAWVDQVEMHAAEQKNGATCSQVCGVPRQAIGELVDGDGSVVQVNDRGLTAPLRVKLCFAEGMER